MWRQQQSLNYRNTFFFTGTSLTSLICEINNEAACKHIFIMSPYWLPVVRAWAGRCRFSLFFPWDERWKKVCLRWGAHQRWVVSSAIMASLWSSSRRADQARARRVIKVDVKSLRWARNEGGNAHRSGGGRKEPACFILPPVDDHKFWDQKEGFEIEFKI